MINFGQGVANEFWKGRGSCGEDQKYYATAARGADILSFDIYPAASADPRVKDKLEYIARGVSRLTNLAVADQKIWAVIETTALDTLHPVTPSQVRSEVWMAIIHGARGIVYSCMNFHQTFARMQSFGISMLLTRLKKKMKSLPLWRMF